MRIDVLALGCLLALAACGDSDPATPTPPPPPTVQTPPPTSAPRPEAFAAEGSAGARAVVEAYLVAAKALDADAMLALGTPEWREKEKTWKKGFTVNITQRDYKLKSYVLREPAIEGETATLSVRAVFLDQGKEDGEGMTFSLVRKDGRWWISDLR
jgi:hypothetical protein